MCTSLFVYTSMGHTTASLSFVSPPMTNFNRNFNCSLCLSAATSCYSMGALFDIYISPTRVI